ncbi:MAG: hypothetical protein ABGY96_19365 [bacterium]|nr:hypothetical protein [Gammaproteobacteria bacterium]HIL94804.1 hypothetical protein [Pseudomonadales bacterium]
MKQQLTIHLDLSSLSGFLSMQPTLDLVEELQIPAQWLPVSGILARLSSKQPNQTSDDPLAAYKARRAKARFQFEQREHHRNCQRLGITEEQGLRHFDAEQVHVGLLYVNQLGIDPRDYITGVYRAGFAQEKTLQTPDEVAELLQGLGISGAGFLDYQKTGKLELSALQQQLLEQSIFDSPAYLYQGERYHGRQHLPLLRWTIEGSKGDPPV